MDHAAHRAMDGSAVLGQVTIEVLLGVTGPHRAQLSDRHATQSRSGLNTDLPRCERAGEIRTSSRRDESSWRPERTCRRKTLAASGRTSLDLLFPIISHRRSVRDPREPAPGRAPPDLP